MGAETQGVTIIFGACFIIFFLFSSGVLTVSFWPFLMRWLVGSSVRWFVGWLVRWLVRWFVGWQPRNGCHHSSAWLFCRVGRSQAPWPLISGGSPRESILAVL